MKYIQWISHRGLCQNCDENSQASFQSAVDEGFNWLETDLRVTSDHKIVLTHDPDFNKIAGVDKKVSDLTLAQVKALVLRQGGGILELNEFSEQFSSQNWVFDIKPESGVECIGLLEDFFSTFDDPMFYQERIIFLFWDKNHQRIFENSFPGATCFAREYECIRAGVSILARLPILGGIKKGKIYSLVPSLLGIPLYTKRIIDEYHKKGAKVLAYLPENSVDIESAYDCGFDYILSNNPPQNRN
ncbi:MAG: hypothetical protein HOE90_03210 [Bacteriovoracaceae bacterium]|jgi:glycerophosphoryl diester phosphodiesterase|nr:hypothetical protein [Bacteriovoracaceae bacterium]